MKERLAVVLPGGSAGPNSGPQLIPALAAEQAGVEVQEVAYPDFRPESLEHEAAAEFDAAVFEQVQELVAAAGSDEVTFIAKSRGTLFLSTMPPLDGVGCRAIWVTPLFGLDYVRAGFVEKYWPSLATAHTWACAQVGAEDLIIEGADHLLVVDRDAQATVAGLSALAEASLRFFGL